MRKLKTILQWGMAGIGILLILSLVRSITRIVGSNEKVREASQHVSELQAENKNLSEELSTLQSVQFIEREARDKLGLAKKGEIVVVLPDEDKLRELAPKFSGKIYSLPDPNWKLWLRLFF